MKTSLPAVLLALFVLCGAVSAQDYQIRAGANINLRDTYSLEGVVVEVVPSGSVLQVVGRFNRWLKIDRNGSALWMADWVSYTRVTGTDQTQTRSATQTQSQIDNCCFVDRQCTVDAEWVSGYEAFQNGQCAAPLQTGLQLPLTSTGSDSSEVNNCCFLNWQCKSDEEWARGHWAFHLGQCKHRGVEIEGSPAFVNAIEQALDILQTRAPQWYAYSINGLTKIREVSEEEGAGVYLHTGAFSITQGHVSAGVLWLASIIVHDACHVHRAAKGLVPGDLTGERECLRLQIDATEVFDYQNRHVPGLRHILANIDDIEYQWWH